MTEERNSSRDLVDELRSLQDLVLELESSERLRLQAERALIASEERFRDLAEMLPEIVYELNNHGIVTFVNRRGLEHTGYDMQDLQRGFAAIDLLVPGDRNRAIVNMGKLLQGRETGKNTYTVRKKDGTTFPVIGTSCPIVKDDQVVGVRGILFVVSQDGEPVARDHPDSEVKNRAHPVLCTGRIRSAVTEALPRWTSLHVHLASMTELLRLIEEGESREKIERFVRERGLDQATEEIPKLMGSCLGCMRTVLEYLETQDPPDPTSLD